MSFAACALLLGVVAMSSAARSTVSDALDREPAPPWEWLRGDGEGRRVEAGSLQVRALAGTLWKTRNDAKNVLLRPWPAGVGDDAVVVVNVRFAPERPGEQAGLILYGSDDDYVKIVREFLDGKRWVVLGREEKADGKMINRVEVTGDDVTLRLTRHGRQITGAFATKDKAGEFQAVGDAELPPLESLRVGLVAHGGPSAASEARWATFRDFRLSAASR